MGKIKVTDSVLYQKRHIISYFVLALMLVGLLYLTGILAPAGISDIERSSVVRSSQMDLTVLTGAQMEQLIHLPYRALQLLSTSLFGVTELSIKLPSLILAGITAIGTYGLLNLWFKRNVAFITTILMITCGQFLLMSQQATPSILYLFWSVALLFSASMIAQARNHRRIWLIITTVISALALYSPYMIYVVISLAATALLHPHARFIVFKQPLWAKLVGGFLFVGLLVPLGLGLYQSPDAVLRLLGEPENSANVSLTFTLDRLPQYIGFSDSSTGKYLTPAYGLGLIALGVLGAIRLFRAKYTAKSYIITIWGIFLVPLILINPAAVAFTVLPLVLFIAFAIDYLIRSWYRLFPFNPYARIAGLIPLSVLVVAIVLSGVQRFVYGYHYDPQASLVYSKDLSLLRKSIASYPSKDIMLVVGQGNTEFYTLYTKSHDDLTNVSVTSEASSTPENPNAVIISSSLQDELGLGLPSKILVSGQSTSANRFYIYEKPNTDV